MIKVIFGTKGVGKTRYLIEDVHHIINDCKGHIVFIDTGNELLTELRHEVRLININEFSIKGLNVFYGFISGLIASNYDIVALYVDRLDQVAGSEPQYEVFFNKIKDLSDKYNIRFIFSTSGNIKDIPDYVKKEYAV